MYKYSASIATMLPKGHTDSKNRQRVGQIYSLQNGYDKKFQEKQLTFH